MQPKIKNKQFTKRLQKVTSKWEFTIRNDDKANKSKEDKSKFKKRFNEDRAIQIYENQKIMNNNLCFLYYQSSY